jgi:hypothetical protein
MIIVPSHALARGAASILLVAVGITAGAQAPGAMLSYDFPADWSRATDPANGIISLMPRGLQSGRVCVLSVIPPQRSSMTAEAFHETMVRRVAAGYGTLLAPPAHDSIGAFRVTSMVQRTSNGIPLWVRVYSVRWNDNGQVLVLTANTAELARNYMPVVDGMVRRVGLPEVAMAPVQSAAPAASPNRAVGMVFGLYSYTTLRPDPLSGTTVMDQYWYLFSPEGRVCRGYTLPRLPVGANYHQFNFNSDPANCGTFEVRGAEVVMSIGQRSPETIVFHVPDSNGKMTIQRATYSLALRW